MTGRLARLARVPLLALAAFAPWTAGCTAEPAAVLEVAFQVDTSDPEIRWWDDGEALYLFVQFRPATSAWEMSDPWPPDPRDPLAFLVPFGEDCLADPERCRATFSVVTTEPDVGLRIKARFCPGSSPESARCDAVDEASGSSAFHFELARPFYAEERTWWNTTLPPVPPPRAAEAIPVERVAPCEIAGCSEDAGWSWTSGARDFCLRSTGEHFCEAP